MRHKSDDHRDAALISSSFPNAAEYRAMAQMHPVKIADSYDGVGKFSFNFIQFSEDYHVRRNFQ
jgi:hypothetical protein